MALLPFAERVARRAMNAGGMRSRFVETRLARHHLYDVRGTGSLPTIVVLHGISSSATPFAGLLARLRPHVRRIIAPEAPGHGFSGLPREPLTPQTLRETMTELLDGELDEPAIVFGNSLGGGVAFGYALDRPERVRGLFLASPAGAPMPAEVLGRFLKTFALESPADGAAFLHRLLHGNAWFVPLVAPDVHRLFARDVVRTFAASVTTDHLLSPEDLARLAMPIHLLWGRSERLLPSEHYAFFAKHLPAHARLERPEGIGHCPHLDAPGRLARKILRFARATQL